MRASAGHLWRAATSLGTEAARPDAVRAVMGANHFFVLASLASLAWAAVLATHRSDLQPLPGVTHLLLVAGWALCLWMNSRGQLLLASAIGLLAPIAQYTYLAHVYGRAAGFQLMLIAVPSLAYVMFGTRRTTMRIGATVLSGALLVWIYADPAFTRPFVDGTDAWIITVAVLNIVTVLVVLGVLAYFNDLYLRRERERADALVTEAQEAADTDPLTGVLNRRGIAPLAESVARGSDFAVALIDVDRFKRVNDQLGHAAGDAVLAGVARALRTRLGDRGHLARWGGEEFVVVLRAYSEREAFAIVEGLRSGLEDEFAAERAVPGGVTISAGVAYAPAGTAVADALAAADRCLYEAKASGRNVVVARELA